MNIIYIQTIIFKGKQVLLILVKTFLQSPRSRLLE